MRQDINLCEQAENAGWVVKKGRTVGDSYTFTNKNDVTVWQCIHDNHVMWCRAETINNHYINHIWNESLIIQLGI